MDAGLFRKAGLSSVKTLFLPESAGFTLHAGGNIAFFLPFSCFFFSFILKSLQKSIFHLVLISYIWLV